MNKTIPNGSLKKKNASPKTNQQSGAEGQHKVETA